jgi:hypothetical protein
MAKHRGRGVATINYPIGMNLGGDPSQALEGGTKIEPYGIYWQAWRSRLQGVAEPNAVVIAESTRRPHAGSWATVFFLFQLVGALLTAFTPSMTVTIWYEL